MGAKNDLIFIFSSLNFFRPLSILDICVVSECPQNSESPPYLKKSFFAPNHTYDENTFAALKNLGINEIIDGYGLMPYTENQIKFIPQLFYKVFALPFGIQTTQIHLNYWKQKEFDDFERFVANNSKKIITYNQALEKINDNIFYSFINFLTKKIIQTKRLLKK